MELKYKFGKKDVNIELNIDPAILTVEQDSVVHSLVSEKNTRWLVIGPRGCGKTTMALHLSKLTDRPILCRDASLRDYINMRGMKMFGAMPPVFIDGYTKGVNIHGKHYIGDDIDIDKNRRRDIVDVFFTSDMVLGEDPQFVLPEGDLWKNLINPVVLVGNCLLRRMP